MLSSQNTLKRLSFIILNELFPKVIPSRAFCQHQREEPINLTSVNTLVPLPTLPMLWICSCNVVYRSMDNKLG